MTTPKPNPMYERSPMKVGARSFVIDSLRLDEIRADLDAYYRLNKIPPAEPRSRK
jgi:hypothetical protein